ncbi:MAG TPA: methyltransferase domain-containing protein [Woeseiaceae bacterium]|nr:methyltransferase domain-containing protein [Woeseiaceae bacterium]
MTEPSCIDAWTEYWRSGSGASCLQGSEAEVRLGRLWDELVEALPDGARVLDLATGNGVVAKACAATARRRGLKLAIEAVDAADIDPPRYVADPEGLLRDVTFRGGVRLEALPYAADTFDAVVAQFGFEYASEERAACEVARCLAPGGRLRFVMHAREGAVARDTALRLERLRSVLDRDGAATLVLALARAAIGGESDALAAAAARLPAAAERLRRLSVGAPAGDAALFYGHEFLRLWARRARYRLADLHRSAEDGWAHAQGVARRQEEMLHAARSADDLEALRARFAACGVEVAAPLPVHDAAGAQIAWQLDGTKPPR